MAGRSGKDLDSSTLTSSVDTTQNTTGRLLYMCFMHFSDEKVGQLCCFLLEHPVYSGSGNELHCADSYAKM